MRENISIDELIGFLNELVTIDVNTISQLIRYRIVCNDELAEHQTVQVSGEKLVGWLGILNGMFGVDEKGFGPITVVLDDSAQIVKFIRSG